jgi:hypothetical protein
MILQKSYINYGLLGVLFLLASLHNFFDQKIFFVFVFFISMLLLVNYKIISFKYFYIFLIAYIFLVITVLYFFKTFFVDIEYENSSLYYFLRVLLGFIFFIFMIIFFRKNYDATKVNRLFNIVILFHVFWLSVQLVFLYSGNSINLVDWYNPMLEQRNTSIHLNGFFRPSGLFNEPGTYSVNISLLLFAKYLFRMKVDWILVLGILSVLATFSTQGIALMGVFTFFVLMNNLQLKKSVLIKIIPFLILVCIMFYFSFDYLIERFMNFDRGDRTLLAKFITLEEYALLDISTKLWGVGLGADIIYKVDNLGFWFTLIFYFGIFGFIMIGNFFFFLILKKRFDLILIFGIIMFTKIELTYMVFWMFLTSVFFNVYYKDKNAF